MTTLELVLGIVSLAGTALSAWLEYRRRRAIKEQLIAESVAENALSAAAALRKVTAQYAAELQEKSRQLAESKPTSVLADDLTRLFKGPPGS